MYASCRLSKQGYHHKETPKLYSSRGHMFIGTIVRLGGDV
jgi:hypothetical protein